jgi:hypothetical protein
MELAQSSINVAVGNTLVVSVPLNDINVPDDLTAFVRSVAESTGFVATYSQADGLQLSWTNTGITRTRSSEATLEDIGNILRNMQALQVEAAQHRNDWSRQDVLQAIAILVTILFGVLAMINPSASAPTSGGNSNVEKTNQVSTTPSQPTHEESTPGQPGTSQHPAPSPNESP